MTAPVITGTWIDIMHLCPRDGVYWNRKTLSYDEAQWHTLVRHLRRDLGIELLMLQNVAKDGVSLYPSKVMARQWPTGCPDPVGAIFRACSREGVQLYPGIGAPEDIFDTSGFGRPTERNYKWHADVSAEILDRYGKEPSFSGFYSTAEQGVVNGRFKADQLEFTRRLADLWHGLLPGRLRIASPWIYGPVERTLALAADISATGMDVLAYQDHQGFGTRYEPTDPREDGPMFENLRWAHDQTPVRVWANTELFAFENDIRFQPLLPGPIERILTQIQCSSPHVDRIVAYTMPGIMTSQSVCPELGVPQTERLYQAYCGYLDAIKAVKP